MAEANEYLEVHLAYKSNNKLGEGLFWDSAREKLLGVDIEGMHFWVFDINTRTYLKIATKQKIGWIIPIECSQYVLTGQEDNISILDFNTGAEVKKIPLKLKGARHRLNDAIADSSGSIWFGSFDESDVSGAKGQLFHFSNCGEITVVDDGYAIANGPAIDLHEKILLHTDSFSKKIYAFDLDVPNGKLSNKRLWKFEGDEGNPDGMCFDSFGNIWIAYWGTGKVCCYGINGNLLKIAKLPVKNVSNVCFSGENSGRLFVSSAKADDANSCRQHQLDGSLFEILGHGATGLQNYYASSNFIRLIS